MNASWLLSLVLGKPKIDRKAGKLQEGGNWKCVPGRALQGFLRVISTHIASSLAPFNVINAMLCNGLPL